MSKCNTKGVSCKKQISILQIAVDWVLTEKLEGIDPVLTENSERIDWVLT